MNIAIAFAAGCLVGWYVTHNSPRSIMGKDAWDARIKRIMRHVDP